MSNKKGKKALKITVITLLSLALIAIIASVWLSSHYEKKVKQNLPQWISGASDSLYKANIENIDINFLTRRITASGVKIEPRYSIDNIKEQAEVPNMVFDMTIPKLEIKGIGWIDLLFDNKFTCRRIVINKPEIEITQLEKKQDSTKKKKEPKLNKLYAEWVEISEAHITYKQDNSKGGFVEMTGGNIVLNKWELFLDSAKKSQKPFAAQKAIINFNSLLFSEPGGLYKLSSEKIELATEKRNFTISGLKIDPTVSNEEFYNKVGYQKDIFTVRFPVIEVEGLNWEELLQNKKILAENIKLKEPDIDIYHSRLPPPDTRSKIGNSPHMLLQKLKMPVNVRKLEIEGGKLTYTEVSDKTGEAAKLVFSGISGNGENITNMPAQLKQNNQATLKMTGTFMETGKMATTFIFNLTADDGAFTVDGSLKDINEKQIDQQARALGMIDLKSLYLKSMDMHIEGNEYAAHGDFTMLYNGLKINMLEVEDSSKLEKKGFMSFLANNVLLYPDNPMPDEEVRHASGQTDRVSNKSFINLIWKTIVQGAINTAERNDQVSELLNKNGSGSNKNSGNKQQQKENKKQEKEEKKEKDKEEKKGFFERLFG